MIGTQVLGGLGQAILSGAARRKAARREKALQKQLYRLEQNRQAIVNPFADVTDLSSQLSNPFANLQVATEAAEMQAQQTDISLASSLDTLRATGAGAGGATALAQAALSSKQGVSASIAQQEAKNAQLRAQGQQQLEMNRMKEQQRIQMAMAQGKQFVFGAQESREMQKLNRVSAQLSNASQQSAAYGSQMMGGIGQALGGIGSFAATGGFGQLFGGNNSTGFADAVSNNNMFNVNSSNTNLIPPTSNDLGAYASGISDRRLKKNINKIGRSQSGLNIYSFEYIDKSFGRGTWQGVMSDEAPKNAVIKNFSSIYDGVDYSKIDVEFKLIK